MYKGHLSLSKAKRKISLRYNKYVQIITIKCKPLFFLIEIPAIIGSTMSERYEFLRQLWNIQCM